MKLRSLLAIVDRILINYFSKNSLLAQKYYENVNWSFYREHFAVLEGRVAYWGNRKKSKLVSSVSLRRNIHRIEKGLVMRPRKPVFALSYIAETINSYESLLQSEIADQDEVRWAGDVLEQYFSSVENTPPIEEQHSRFTLLKPKIENIDGLPTTPIKYADLERSDIDFLQLKTLITNRKSVRWFQDRLVPKKKITDAITVAKQAPSSCNRQPYNFYVTSEPKAAQQIADCAMGTVGYVRNIRSIVVVVGDLSAFFSERDRHLIYIDGSLAVMQFILAIETLGLSTCCINWPDIPSRERRIRKLLKLERFQRPIILIAVGYADSEGQVPSSLKRSNDSIIKDISI